MFRYGRASSLDHGTDQHSTGVGRLHRTIGLTAGDLFSLSDANSDHGAEAIA